jgi:Uncharacterized protein conserved in bacteria (DUF2325)
LLAHDAVTVAEKLDASIDRATARYATTAVLQFVPPRQSSRRRRLWELEGHAHCPVVGLCLPMDVLRRLFARARKADVPVDDYALHCEAMAECKRRTPVAEAMQREFDRRYALTLQQSSRLKSMAELGEWWQEARHGVDLPGAVWATLTHSRCTHALEHQVLGEVHMLQHQVGAAHRVDCARFEAALQELAESRRAIAALQERLQRQTADHTRELDLQQAQLLKAQAEILRRDTLNASTRDELDRLTASIPGLKKREALSRESQWQRDRVVDLERALNHAQQEVERQRRRADEAQAELVAATASPDAAVAREDTPAAASFDERSILCVGGRPASVPLYRHIVERSGGRFMHHDGGDEQNVARLDATLAAADLVICQTGCISHDAYWRVKDHCKRTGKPCVFVENPGTASLRRALAELKPLAPA